MAVGPNEINVEDPILWTPIAKDDLIVLSDGKCYARSSMRQALRTAPGLRLTYTQQVLLDEDIDEITKLGVRGLDVPTWDNWRNFDEDKNVVPFDFAFVKLIAEEPQWQSLMIKAIKQVLDAKKGRIFLE